MGGWENCCTVRQEKKNWITRPKVKLTSWLVPRSPIQCERTLFPASFASSTGRKNITITWSLKTKVTWQNVSLQDRKFITMVSIALQLTYTELTIWRRLRWHGDKFQFATQTEQVISPSQVTDCAPPHPPPLPMSIFITLQFSSDHILSLSGDRHIIFLRVKWLVQEHQKKTQAGIKPLLLQVASRFPLLRAL